MDAIRGITRRVIGVFRSSCRGEQVETDNGNLLSRLNVLGDLFQMTARVHGKSPNKTSNKRRLCVANAAEDQTRSPKRPRLAERRNGNNGGGNKAGDEREPAPDLKERKFVIQKWEPDDFFAFLASADAEVQKLRQAPASDELRKYFEAEFLENRTQGLRNEGIICDRITSKFEIIANELDATAGIGNIRWNSGMPDKWILPGRDNAIDHLFSRTVVPVAQNGAHQNNNQDQPVIPPPVAVEVKVPWNYPGGKVTSGDVDAGRLGRDVSLVDLANAGEGKPIESKADHSVTKISERDDLELDSTEDDNTNRPQASNVRPTSRKNGRPPKGTYAMKHEVFPPRQLVSYMLSGGIKHGYLTTGYRVDFCELHVEDDDDEVILKVAGPFWTVGGMNPILADFLKENKAPTSWNRYEETIATSTTFDPQYYGKTGVRKYSEDQRMLFFRRNEDDADPEIHLANWSTDIGDYSCNEGLLRFLLAATSVTKDPKGKQIPKHSVKLPLWYKKYARAEKLERRTDIVFPGQEQVEEAEETVQEAGGKVRSLSLESDESFYLQGTIDNAVVSGKTEFGPLCLADLQDPRRYQEGFQPYGRLKGDAVQIGKGRNGPAFRQTVRGVDLVCKQVVGIGCILDDIEEQIMNLRYEMCCYARLESLQGDAVPKFLFAGKLVDNRFWVCPERGHLYGLATTWEGERLNTKAGVELVNKMLQKEMAQESRIEEGLMQKLKALLTRIHDCGVLHNDLELRNIVCNGEKLAFIDFDAAMILEGDANDETQKSAEVDRLQRLLGEFSWIANSEL